MTDRTPTSQEPTTPEGAREALATAALRSPRLTDARYGNPMDRSGLIDWAAAILAALTDLGYSVVPRSEVERLLGDLDVIAMLPVYVPPKPEDEDDRYLLRGAVLELVRRATAALRSSDDSTPDGAR